MVHQKINYAIISCHQLSVFLIRRGNALYISRKYSYDESPQLRAFCHLLLATETVRYTEKEFPSLTIPREWAKLYSKDKLWSRGTVGLVSE